jgi:hypothetical protein
LPPPELVRSLSPLAALAFLVGAVSPGCDALAENPGRNPSTEPHPSIALDCETVASAGDILGGPVEPGSEVAVARRFLSRHGLRPDDRLSVEHGAWEPQLAAVRVTRAGRTVGSLQLERETDGWIIRAFALCDDFAER